MKANRFNRLPWLLALLAILLVLRWWDHNGVDGDAISQAVIRTNSAPPRQVSVPASAELAVPGLRHVPESEVEAARDVFAVRGSEKLATPEPPPPAPSPVRRAPSQTLAQAPRIAAVSAVPEEALPVMQIIGTWTDAKGPSVFVHSADGLGQARANDIISPGFRVTRIEESHVILHSERSGKEVRLDVPRVTAQTPR
jgi:hypothetical protein